jgi:hypothetical protein
MKKSKRRKGANYFSFSTFKWRVILFAGKRRIGIPSDKNF